MDYYWDKFYKESFNFTILNSSFSEWCLYHFSNKEEIKLIDIGCGNGRDLIFFNQNNIDCKGIDSSNEVIKKLKENGLDVELSSCLNFDYKDFNVLYCRFIFHTLNISELNILLNTLSKSSKNNSMLFVETRLSEDNKDHIKNFNSGIGESHIRYLYSEKTIKDLIEKYNFEIEDIFKSKGLSKFNGEDPLILRIIANKKTTIK